MDWRRFGRRNCSTAGNDPRVGPITATALVALSPAPALFQERPRLCRLARINPTEALHRGKPNSARFRSGRANAAAPAHHRRRAVTRQARRRGAPQGSWLARMFARLPPMPVIVALATRWPTLLALLAKGGVLIKLRPRWHSRHRLEVVEGCRKVKRKGMAQQSMRDGIGKTRPDTSASSTLSCVDQIRELPYGSATSERSHIRGRTRQHPTTRSA